MIVSDSEIDVKSCSIKNIHLDGARAPPWYICTITREHDGDPLDPAQPSETVAGPGTEQNLKIIPALVVQ